jgi:hypothetical protein
VPRSLEAITARTTRRDRRDVRVQCLTHQDPRIQAPPHVVRRASGADGIYLQWRPRSDSRKRVTTGKLLHQPALSDYSGRPSGTPERREGRRATRDRRPPYPRVHAFPCRVCPPTAEASAKGGPYEGRGSSRATFPDRVRTRFVAQATITVRRLCPNSERSPTKQVLLRKRATRRD